jgi:hypothetical protein
MIRNNHRNSKIMLRISLLLSAYRAAKGGAAGGKGAIGRRDWRDWRTEPLPKVHCNPAVSVL